MRTDVNWLCGVTALLISVGCGAADAGEVEPVAEADESLDVGRFEGWEDVAPPGVIQGPPAVLNVDGNLNQVEVYGLGTDNAVWFASRTSSTAPFQGWSTLGGAFTSKPAAAMFNTDRRAVVGKGTDNRIWITVTGGGATPFEPWEPILTGSFVGAPAVAYLSPHLYVVARKADKHVYWTRNDVSQGLNEQNWSQWQTIPNGLLESEPAISSGLGHVVVAARGGDNRIYIAGTTSTTWSVWKSVGTKAFQGAPAISFHASGVELTARASNNFLYVATANAGTGATLGWDPILGLTTPSGPGTAADASGSGRFGVAARLNDGTVRFNLWQ